MGQPAIEVGRLAVMRARELNVCSPQKHYPVGRNRFMQHAEQKAAVMAQVEIELAQNSEFSNMHGITRANVRKFLVDPYPVKVDPDDAVSAPREMWVILQEYSDPKSGYVVVIDVDVDSFRWGIAEHIRSNEWILITRADSLTKALDDM